MFGKVTVGMMYLNINKIVCDGVEWSNNMIDLRAK
jgi:hypothetical protein